MSGPDKLRATVDAKAAWVAALFDALGGPSRDGRGFTRDTYGEGETLAHRLVAEHARAMELEVAQDAAGNTLMTWPGRDRSAPAILTGSHLDTVPVGGNFDGAAGVAAGLAAVAALRESGFVPRQDITVMATRAEESVWFEVSYIGSRSALGTLPAGSLERPRIDTGRTLAEHMRESGADPDAIRRGERSIDPARVAAFVELHIEQAPSLVEAGVPLAIATGIPGNVRFPDARIHGRYDHVGTPRRFRRDAATAAAEFATRLDALWVEHETRGVQIAITLGRFGTDPAAHGLTTVAGEFRFSLDVRAYDEAVLAALEASVTAMAEEIAARRGVNFSRGTRASAKVGHLSPTLIAELSEAADALGIAHQPLGSPASHDAAAFAAAGVPAAMILVRNEGGSHNPEERMAIADLLAGTAVLAEWLRRHAG